MEIIISNDEMLTEEFMVNMKRFKKDGYLARFTPESVLQAVDYRIEQYQKTLARLFETEPLEKAQIIFNKYQDVQMVRYDIQNIQKNIHATIEPFMALADPRQLKLFEAVRI